VREAVGRVRLEGERAYGHLYEVYRALRLMVNYVQPSFKLQEIIPKGDREQRVYDLAQTPLQRLLASGVLSEERNAVWRQSHFTGKGELSRESLQVWLAALSHEPAAQTGTRRTMSTVAAYARSARAFCNWLVQQGYVATSIFPPDAIPHVPWGLPRPVEPETFLRLLRACQLSGAPGGLHAGLTARNHAILWLLLDTGVSVSELCALRLADVDRVGGTVTVHGTKGNVRTLPLSADGQRVVRIYLDVFRLTPAWEPVVPEARDRLLLTERRRPLTRNSLTLLFERLNQRAGFTRSPICPSMLRDTYAIRFLQAGGELSALQQQLGVSDYASVKRYQLSCEQQSQKRDVREASKVSLPIQNAQRGKRKC
jgi:integrase